MPLIANGTVHVWRVDCEPTPSAVRRARRLVDEDELATAARQRSVTGAERLLLAHAAVRLLLGGALGDDPRALRFVRRCGECGAVGHGKPYLDGSADAAALDFSLSHAGDFALVAIARGRRIGVDIEAIRRAGDPMLAGEFLAAGEQRAIASLTPAERSRAAARSWTRKEALLKGHGRGITGDLRALQMQPLRYGPIDHDGLEPPGVAAPGGASCSGRARWRIVTLQPWPEYLAALAGEGVWRLRRWTLDLSRPDGVQPRDREGAAVRVA